MFIRLCHDLAELVVGDIPTYAGVLKGRQKEVYYKSLSNN